MCAYLKALAALHGKAFHRHLCSKTQATPLGKVEIIRITQEDYRRLQRLQHKKRNAVVGFLLVAGVLTFYGYSMYAVKQDPLQLDELLEDNMEKSNSSSSSSTNTS